MMIFNSYVSLPEGQITYSRDMVHTLRRHDFRGWNIPEMAV